eukprot:206175-Prymnesium_polylepis.1
MEGYRRLYETRNALECRCAWLHGKAGRRRAGCPSSKIAVAHCRCASLATKHAMLASIRSVVIRSGIFRSGPTRSCRAISMAPSRPCSVLICANAIA